MISPKRQPQAFETAPNATAQLCDAPDCNLPGTFRAPKSRDSLRQFHWFCLEHVRAYNLSWDYNKGMTPEEIEAQLRADFAWQRPSWPLGHLGHTGQIYQTLETQLNNFIFCAKNAPAPTQTIPVELREALSILGLTWPVTMEAVKARYKQLAKLHHPDANGGNKVSEETLKSVNLAYAVLRGKLPPQLTQNA